MILKSLVFISDSNDLRFFRFSIILLEPLELELIRLQSRSNWNRNRIAIDSQWNLYWIQNVQTGTDQIESL